MVFPDVNSQIAALFGSVVAVRTLVHWLFSAAFERLVAFQRAFPTVTFTAVLTTELVFISRSQVLWIWIPSDPVYFIPDAYKKKVKKQIVRLRNL